MKMFCIYSDHVHVFTRSRSGANDSRVIMREVTKKDMKRNKVGVCHLVFLLFYIDLLTHRSAIKADPLSQRMPWGNCRVVPSQQLPQVLCGASA